MIKNLNEKEIKRILSSNYIGHLGYINNNRPYVVPITYYYDEKKSAILCYSGEGHKTISMRKNNNVSIQIDDISLVTNWKSVLVVGQYKQLFATEAKSQLHDFSLGVKNVILKKELREVDFISEFSSKIYKDDLPIVFRIIIEEIFGKSRKM